MNAARRHEDLRLALMFLTRLPVGQLREPPPTLSQARWAFPLVGLVVGGAGAAVWLGAGFLGAPVAVAAALALGAQLMVTGGLHADGLADFADGMGGGRDKGHVLDIMRDSRIGSYGVLALVLMAALWIGALAALSPAEGALALLGLGVASRFAMLVLLVEMPPARDDGLGQGATAPGRPYLAGGIASGVLLLLLGPPGVAASLAMAAAVWVIARRALRRIGGQTGDVLGAAQLSAETAGLVALTLL